MKTKLIVLFIASLVACNLGVLAHNGNEGDHNGDGQGCDEGDNAQGGNIDGSETLIADVVLIATNNAPAGASGQAKLESDNEDGTVTATLKIETQGLAAG